MPRRSRHDSPGSWHHVFNRALSKRTLFLSREDHRYFLACLAGAVHAGTIEVHRFALVVNLPPSGEEPKGTTGFRHA